jgi:hypothetical protein
MRILISAVAVALLAGCASTLEERRADGPQVSFSSAKTVDAVSRCIFFSWQNYTWYAQPISVLIQPNQYEGNTVSSGEIFADVILKDGKTQINYYGMRGAINTDLKALSKACI